MKNPKNILFAGALSIALIGAFASNAVEMPAPFYGIHPTNGQCIIGTIDNPLCSTPVQPLRCTVTFTDGQTSIAFDNIASTTVCTAPVYKATN